MLQLNPAFLPGGTVADLVAIGTLHPECERVFRIDKTDSDRRGKNLLLHAHQRDAILKAKEGTSYILTSGTGSGKSLAYIIPIVDTSLARTRCCRGCRSETRIERCYFYPFKKDTLAVFCLL